MNPVELRRVGENLRILWEDQSLNDLSWASIRKACSCAICLELSQPLTGSEAYFARAVTPLRVNPVGRYAVEIQWEDGHRSIVSFDRLEHLAKSL